jgi:macrolide transport system ATP-binding/permease protein
MLEVKDVYKTYRMGDNVVHALNGVTITIEDGDFVAIMGPSGSGKSTLMHLLGLLDVPTTGSYQINGREIAGLTEDELAVLRRGEIGFIFQQFNLLPRMSATENVALPHLYSRNRPDYEFANEQLKAVGLGSRLEHRTNELSGGQQQRVAIARSLVNKPRMILADEPTGNLDSTSEHEVMEILKKLNASGITLVVVTHEEEIGAQAKRRIRMRDGKVQSDERLDGTAGPSRPTEQLKPVQIDSSLSFLQLVQHTREGFKTLLANKVRTGLSMLGILIGVAAVIAMLAIGRGAQKAIEAQLASLGSNLLVVRPGVVQVGGVRLDAGNVSKLTIDDVAAIKEKLPATAIDVSPSVNGRGQVTYLNKNWSTQLLGAGSAYARMHAAEPEYGRFFTDDEDAKRARVAVVGATIVRELFGGESPIGEMIKINKVGFQIIGVLPFKGANGFRDQDDIIVVPVQTAMHRVLGKNYVDSIDVEAAPNSNMDQAISDIQLLMTSRHKIPLSQTSEAFQVRNMADIQAAMMESSNTMSLLLATIAAISLLVGGIGIMNIMLVSVTERTREIGLRKAVGARPADILEQFLIESVVVSAVGGTIGILVGWGITLTLSLALGWSTSVSPVSVALSFFFSAGVGIVFGIYPAKKAAALNPIEALRYE